MEKCSEHNNINNNKDNNHNYNNNINNNINNNHNNINNINCNNNNNNNSNNNNSDNLKSSQVTDNWRTKRIKRFDTRLESLWYTLQALAWSYETIQISQRRIANQFREIQDYFVTQEQQLNKILIEEFEKTTASINNIINEIANLNAHRTKPTFNHNNNNNNDEDDDNDDEDEDEVDMAGMNQLVQSIQTSKSIDQFIDKAFKESDDITWTDDQLLDFVRRGSQSIQTVHTVTRPLLIDIDIFKLQHGIKELMRTCFEFQKSPRVDHGFRNHIFSFYNDSCSILDVDTGEWTVINDRCTPRVGIFKSVVYARGNVYVFGGDHTPNTYSRFSLAELKWHNDLEITGIDGGANIGACYDGDNLIYLVGGYYNDRMLDRVDCFNIDTQQFATVGRLSVTTRVPYTFVNNNRLFIVGGYVDVQCRVTLTDILVFDLARKKCDTFIKTNFRPDESILPCYDGKDSIFIVGDETTTMVSLSKKLALTSVSIHTGYDNSLTCLFTQSRGLVLLNGDGDNFIYSILQSQWIPLEGDDPLESRPFFGTCHIYH
ncbi:hypothetical protein SAMD00019534_078930 [Acytostelium subglobosum LB1]|uniref:hypothetical protein n=1 Tax=Acytostelium subglobosum LB1 TaxID=1410327 RepID=UPI00064496C6|nr:hypothetical protein SAMD00019534_078930 [Acytostelium subglobosum LB1]GAM24718.1 hypothetical protein SAMD00019534_078930 [Acytostelium subglobosum LB1]|eukprot:XP_012752387.1 hypothetical protein SAMD00019534_078930 [Acytostelium subglobosum LB1]